MGRPRRSHSTRRGRKEEEEEEDNESKNIREGERAAAAVFFFSSSLAFAQSADFFLAFPFVFPLAEKRCRREGKVSQRLFFLAFLFLGRERKRI